MPDPFTNARPYNDVSFPSSGDGFSIAGTKNAFQALGFLDVIPLQPRAHSPADARIMVRGRDASGFYNPVYFGNADQRIPFVSGDTTSFSAPASNARIDIVYVTPSGDIKIQQGTEAASPTLPSLSPSGDTRFPICAVWNKVGQTKIVNFEDKDSNSGDGYIYQDLRPWMRAAGAGAASVTSLSPLSPTGDNAVGTALTAARADHTHQGVHTMRIPGSGDLFGDIQLAGPVQQQGNRITIANVPSSSFRNLKVTRPSTTTVKIEFDELVMHDRFNRAAWAFSKSVTLDITQLGAGGRTGLTELANTLYYIWIIMDKNGVVSGILDTSPIAPTVPGPYDYRALVSVVGNDNSSNFIDFKQIGMMYRFVTWATMASGTLGTWDGTFAAFDLTPANMSTNPGFVPTSISDHCFGVINAQGVVNIAISNIAAPGTATNDETANVHATDSNKHQYWDFQVITEDTLYATSNSVETSVQLSGFYINKIT